MSYQRLEGAQVLFKNLDHLKDSYNWERYMTLKTALKASTAALLLMGGTQAFADAHATDNTSGSVSHAH